MTTATSVTGLCDALGRGSVLTDPDATAAHGRDQAMPAEAGAPAAVVLRSRIASGEDGDGWTTLVVDRATRRLSVAQAPTQLAAAAGAVEILRSVQAQPPAR